MLLFLFTALLRPKEVKLADRSGEKNYENICNLTEIIYIFSLHGFAHLSEMKHNRNVIVWNHWIFYCYGGIFCWHES
jgi:hypothetical protein